MANKNIQVRNQNTIPTYRDSFSDFNQLAERFFSDPFGSWLADFPQITHRPNATVRETDQGYLLTAEIPGIAKENVNISVNGNMLEIHAEQKNEEGDVSSEGGYRRQSRSYHQSFTLPSTVNSDQIEAHCDHGILEVMIPKAGAAQPRRIEVKSHQAGETAQKTEAPKKPEPQEQKH